MSKFAILRVQKLKSPKSVRASMKHAYREQDTPNADATRTPDNDLIGPQNVKQGMVAFEKALPEKIRKNAVQCIEYLVTSSPGAFENRNADQEAYLNEALRWIQERHDKDNVIAAIIHRDEKTPHLSAYVVPKDPDTGRLNCRRFLGGAKALNEMQTDFARVVGRPVGLERGIEGSKATHTKLKTYYGALERDAPEHKNLTPADLKPQVLKKGIFTSVVEDSEQVAKRISQTMQQHYEPAIQSATVARTATKRAKEDRESLKQLQTRLGPLMKVLRDIPTQYREKVVESCLKLAQQLRQKLQEQAVEAQRERAREIGRNRSRENSRGRGR